MNKTKVLGIPLFILAIFGAAYSLQSEEEAQEGRRPLVSRRTEKVKEFRSEDLAPAARKQLLEDYHEWARTSTIEVVEREVVETGSALTIYAFYLQAQ